MVIFSPQDDQARINKKMDAIYKKQKDAQFGPDRFGVYFLPGDYTKGQPNHVYNIGYYTSINGLGAVPTQTKLANVASPAALRKLLRLEGCKLIALQSLTGTKAG